MTVSISFSFSLTQTMHKAAQRLLGEHDFRNFCKVNADVFCWPFLNFLPVLVVRGILLAPS